MALADRRVKPEATKFYQNFPWQQILTWMKGSKRTIFNVSPLNVGPLNFEQKILPFWNMFLVMSLMIDELLREKYLRNKRNSHVILIKHLVSQRENILEVLKFWNFENTTSLFFRHSGHGRTNVSTAGK